MALRPCLECGRPSPGPRCPTHTAAKQQAKDARRPTRRSYAETQRRRQQVRDQPWCEVCGTTQDLTAAHLDDVATSGREDGPLTTQCRHHNSSAGATIRRGMSVFS